MVRPVKMKWNDSAKILPEWTNSAYKKKYFVLYHSKQKYIPHSQSPAPAYPNKEYFLIKASWSSYGFIYDDVKKNDSSRNVIYWIEIELPEEIKHIHD